MAPSRQCLASMAQVSLSRPHRPIPTQLPRFLAPSFSQSQVRHKSGQQPKSSRAKKEKKKMSKELKKPNISGYPQYSLCDAMRIFRAYEVGKPPNTVKYTLAVRLNALRNGPVIKTRIKLPNPMQTDDRIAVICPEDSDIAKEAIALGAVAAGEETIFEAVKSEQINFTKLICHPNSESALNKANLGRILGPKGMMPSKKMGTITPQVKKMLQTMVGATEFRERTGVVRITIGQLNHTPKQVGDNIKAFMELLQSNIRRLQESSPKKVHEVVLSTNQGPGISLNGKFNATDPSVGPDQLVSAM